MAYITGTVTDANPGPTLYALIAPALTTAGYTLVDTVVVSTRTHKIWKSAAANNSQALDWYLDIVYTTTGAGTLAIAPFEYFDPATDLAYRGLYSFSDTPIETTYYSRYGASGSGLESGNWLTATGSYTSYQIPLVTTFGYWISITPERVIMLLSNSLDRLMFAGFYSPDSLYAAKAGAALYPLMGAVLVSGLMVTSTSTTLGSVTGALTRLPPRTTALSGSGWAQHLYVPGLQPYEYASYPQIPSGSQQLYPLSAVPIQMFAYSSGSAVSAHYGTVRDVLIAAASASVFRGDTCTISGQPYVFTSMTANQALLFRAV